MLTENVDCCLIFFPSKHHLITIDRWIWDCLGSPLLPMKFDCLCVAGGFSTGPEPLQQRMGNLEKR